MGSGTHSCDDEEVKDSAAVPPRISIAILVLTLV